MITRYWINGTSFCCAEGDINENNVFVFYDSLGKRTIFNGYHFATKKDAFYDYLKKSAEKIDNIENEVEILREKL